MKVILHNTKGGNGRVAVVHWGRYQNGRVAIELLPVLRDEFSSPLLRASVNVPSITFAADEIAIKDYSENEGLLSDLVAANVVLLPAREIRVSEFAVVHVCKLTSQALEDLNHERRGWSKRA